MSKCLSVLLIIWSLITLTQPAIAFNSKNISHAEYSPWVDATGGPDAFGYTWIDTDEPGGPVYQWIDITNIGTNVPGLSDDNYVGPFDLGFDFLYYGYTVTEFYIGSNGYIKFPPAMNITASFPPSIPRPSEPNDYIGVYASDLDFTTGGDCYYWSNNTDSCIVSWIDVPWWNIPGSSHTFQVIFDALGKTIVMNYGEQIGEQIPLDMIIGIENDTGLLGLEHSRDTNVPHSDYGVVFHYPPGPAEITLSTDVIYFYGVAVGTQTDLLLTIYNTGDEDLIIYDLIIDDPVFTTNYSVEDSLIEPAGSLPLTVSFLPVAASFYDAEIWIYSNDDTVMVILEGTGYDGLTITGNCYLENQTNHSGTKVLFLADSPSAFTCSTYTNLGGDYEMSVAQGAYDIVFSNEGYWDEEILDQLLFSATTLPEVTLLQSPAGIPISGELSGTLMDTTYFVIGDISVQGGDSLIIDAGATLIFGDGFSFDIDGYIHAAGTETDSIWFINIPIPDSTWGGIDFNGSADDSSRLEYCLISGSNSSGIYCSSSSPVFSNCTISNNTGSNGGGIYCYSSSPSISNCILNGNIAYDVGGGILCNSSSAIIEGCNIIGNYANTGGGLYIWGSATIGTCLIAGNCANVDSSAAGGNGGGLYVYNCACNIINCTFSDNLADNNGSGIRLNLADCTMTNLIIEGNNGNGGIHFLNSPNSTITYCDFSNNVGGNFIDPPPYVGQIVTVNANGDPCDLYMNIFEDPRFVNPTGGNYNLQYGSPCIDAGDPASPLDPDSSICDIGAFWFNGTSSPIPEIALSDEELDFGLVEVGELLELPLTIYSEGDTTLEVLGVYTTDPDFYTDFNPLSGSVEPGDSLVLTVTFEPSVARIYQELLYIVSNTIDDTVIVSLWGDGGAVPSPVENLLVEIEYPDALLTWDEVTTSVSGFPMDIDYYIIYFETDAYDEYEFLAYIPVNSYVHEGVVQFASSMFYIVDAYIGDIGMLDELLASKDKVTRDEVRKLMYEQLAVQK